MSNKTKELLLCLTLQLVTFLIIPFVGCAITPYIPCKEFIDYFFTVTLILFGTVGFIFTTIFIWNEFRKWRKDD